MDKHRMIDPEFHLPLPPAMCVVRLAAAPPPPTLCYRCILACVGQILRRFPARLRWKHFRTSFLWESTLDICFLIAGDLLLGHQT